MRSTACFLLVLAWVLAGAAQAQTTYVLLEEDFEGLTLGPNVDEGVAGTAVWTDIPSPGWTNDASGVPGIEDPATDGVTEWAGWGFADKAWWVQTAEDQRRSEFTLGQGTVAIADADEWDDATHPKNYPANTYDVWLSTPAIDLSSARPGTVQLKFDSSWRPEYDDDYHQTATITASFDGGERIEVLRWESDSASPKYKDDNSTNQTITLDIPNPAGAASMVLTFGLFDAGNDWWWAIDNIVVSGQWSGSRASKPSPASGTKEVSVKTVLSWTPGDYANQHRILLSDDLAAITAGTAVASTQDANSYDAVGQLDFGTTYYWRIDEANSTAGWDEGSVWSFTTESFSYPLAVAAVTASSAQQGMSAENAINGSGLDDQDQHSVDGTQMWMTDGVIKPDWIQFEFDSVHKLDMMWVWNSNQLIESMIGFGAKDVTVEYSVDGQVWTQLEAVPQFARATGMPTYTANTVVPFDGAVARFVKLTINANWGAMAPQTGLSEVRFFSIPVQANAPQPADGATNVDVETDLSWRAGREAVSHKVCFDSDPQAVAAGTAPVDTVGENLYTPDGLLFGATYYWKVTEVNQAEAVAEWEGPVWALTVEQYGAIDNFDSYTDDIDAEATIWHAWIDGLTNGASGSQVGYTNSPFAERSIVHAGRQSMPLTYDNSKAPFYSEAERTFSSPQDWTTHGADSLCIYFQGVAGDTGNSAESVYLTVKDSSSNSKTVVNPDAAATTQTDWQQWTIPLSEFTSAGVKMTAIKSIAIGVGNRTSPASGGTGIMYFDDLGFGRSAP
jgi:hypothetical protein